MIPTFSVDGGMVLERDTSWFGHDLRQTLEPRLLYTNTPYHRQDGLPNFDSAAKDVNFESSFSQNTFSGVDRVSDANQVTAGVTTRLLDPRTEGELMRLAMVQSYLFSDQRITPDGKPLTRRVSDLLLLGSTNLIPQWTLKRFVEIDLSGRAALLSATAFAITHTLAFTAAIEHLHIAGDDFSGIALYPILFPGTGAQTAFDIEFGAFLDIFGHDLGQPLVEHYPVPFGALLSLSGVLVFPAF